MRLSRSREKSWRKLGRMFATARRFLCTVCCEQTVHKNRRAVANILPSFRQLFSRDRDNRIRAGRCLFDGAHYVAAKFAFSLFQDGAAFTLRIHRHAFEWAFFENAVA